MEVEITSRKVIKPSTPTPEHSRIVKLSCFDHIAPPSYTSSVLFYPRIAETLGTREKITHLQTSLSQALSVAFPFAGKLNEEENSVHCNDEGAELREAQVNWTLDRVLKDEAKATLMRQLLPFPNELDHTPELLLAVQVNIFGCGGMAIGVSLSHKLVDGFTFYSFVKGWAASKKCLSFDAAAYLPLTKRINSNYDMDRVPVPDNNAGKLVTKRFVFFADALANLKAETMSEASRVQVSAAVIWKAKIMVAKAKRCGALRDSLFITPFNIRGRTGVWIPEDAAGNLFTLVAVKFQAEGSEPVSLVREGIRKVQEECAKIGDADELFRLATDKTREIQGEVRRGEADVCLFTSLCRFPCYEADFGWGRPALVASGNKPLDMVEMRDTRCGTGIEAWVTLEPSDMLLFQQHPHVLAFTNLM